MKLEDLKVGDSISVDTLLEGPFFIPAWPPEGGCVLFEVPGPLTAGSLAPPADSDSE